MNTRKKARIACAMGTGKPKRKFKVAKKTDELEGINIADEYQLVQQGVSKLSVRLRELVKYRYNHGER